MTTNQKTLFQIFTTFLKIGAFTFGGGYAMIPLVQKETVEKRHWIEDNDILEIVAIAESTPGPIAVNAATFVGYRIAGFAGAVCGTVGVVLPSFVIIVLISYVLREFESMQIVRYAFQGIRAGVLALILQALWMMYRQVPKNASAYLLMAVAFVLTAFLDINVVWVIIGCAVYGIGYAWIAKRRHGR